MAEHIVEVKPEDFRALITQFGGIVFVEKVDREE